MEGAEVINYLNELLEQKREELEREKEWALEKERGMMFTDEWDDEIAKIDTIQLSLAKSVALSAPETYDEPVAYIIFYNGEEPVCTRPGVPCKELLCWPMEEK